MTKFFTTALITIALAGLTASFVYSPNINSAPASEEVAGELSWFTDFQKANAESIKTGKPIFGFFTGSDWCGWCRKMQADVFAKEDFKTWAKKEVILLELDFPKRKAIPTNIRQQNQQLAKLFGVRGYPTVWIFNTVKDEKTNQVNINAWGSLSYPRTTKGQESKKFLADAARVFAKQKK